MVKDGQADNLEERSGNLLLWLFAAVALLPHFLTNSRYGYFRDELYYIACGRHPAFGYVDQPPLSIWLVRLSSLLFGDSLFALRLFPAAAAAITVSLTGLIARQLRGRSGAIALSCTASLCATVFLADTNFYSMNAFEPPLWMGCIYLLLRLLNGGSPRLWLWFGLLAGLGLENKHSMVFFGVGLVVGILATPARRYLAQRWIWLGGLIAFLIALPNVIWEIQHHWATWELLHNVARSNKNIVLSPLQFLSQQILIMNPGTLPLWLTGLLWLVLAKAGRRYLALAIAFLVTLAEFILLHGKVYYLAPAYPMLFAAGAVAFEGWCQKSVSLDQALPGRRHDRNGSAPRAPRAADPSAAEIDLLPESDSPRAAAHGDFAHRRVAAALCRSIRLAGDGSFRRARLSRPPA